MEAARYIRAGDNAEQSLIVAQFPTSETFPHITVQIDSDGGIGNNGIGISSIHRNSHLIMRFVSIMPSRHTMYSISRLLVISMCPGACVIANSGFDAITAA